MAAAVVAVQEGVYDEFKEKLVQAAKDIVIGNGLEDNVFLGPVIREENKERTLNYVDQGVEGYTKVNT